MEAKIRVLSAGLLTALMAIATNCYATESVSFAPGYVPEEGDRKVYRGYTPDTARWVAGFSLKEVDGTQVATRDEEWLTQMLGHELEETKDWKRIETPKAYPGPVRTVLGEFFVHPSALPNMPEFGELLTEIYRSRVGQLLIDELAGAIDHAHQNDNTLPNGEVLRGLYFTSDPASCKHIRAVRQRLPGLDPSQHRRFTTSLEMGDHSTICMMCIPHISGFENNMYVDQQNEIHVHPMDRAEILFHELIHMWQYVVDRRTPEERETSLQAWSRALGVDEETLRTVMSQSIEIEAVYGLPDGSLPSQAAYSLERDGTAVVQYSTRGGILPGCIVDADGNPVNELDFAELMQLAMQAADDGRPFRLKERSPLHTLHQLIQSLLGVDGPPAS
ncbi:MAG: hypothetical protein LBJ69_02255 [Holosporales bacterium]|jgi:hypothetical protein|nr:hypothetical protein [Holosporales bacterium]